MFLLDFMHPEGWLLISVIITVQNSQRCHCRFQSLEEGFAAGKLVDRKKRNIARNDEIDLIREPQYFL